MSPDYHDNHYRNGRKIEAYKGARNIADLTDFVNTNKEQAGAAAAKCSRPPLEEVTEDFPPPPPEELGSDSESFKLSAVIAARSKVSLLVRLAVFSQCFNF